MRFMFRAGIVLLAALPLLTIAAIARCLQDRPLVTGVAQLTAQDIERARRVLEAQDPRKVAPDGLHTVTIDERDLGLALNYLASRQGHGAARVALRAGGASLQVSLELPPNPFGRYLNIDAAFGDATPASPIEHLQLGNLTVPRFVAGLLWRESVRRFSATDQGRLAARVVKSAHFGDGRLTLVYEWSDDLAARAHSVLMTPDDQLRLRAYQEHLADAVERAPRTVSLATLMPSLFRLALDRGASGDQVSENRAALVVLALYVTGQPLQRLAPDAAPGRSPARRSVTLAGRDDFPKHFLVSAAIAAEAGSPLADAIGVYKEVADARGGSGFSFNDIAADRAGTRFGEVASQSRARARELARAVASGVEEADFMPNVSDLPEFLSAAEFQRRYGGVDGPGYTKMLAAIDQRISALRLPGR